MKIDTAMMDDMAATDWIIEGLIPRASQITLFGKPGIGKSLLALHLAIQISHMEPVLFLDYEMSLPFIKDRLKAFGEYEAVNNGLNYHAYAASDLKPLDTEEGSLGLADLIADYGTKVLFIDAMAGAVAGGENDNDTYRLFAQHTADKLREHQITTVRIDHLSIKADQHAGPRGASRKIDDVDLAWEFQTVGTENAYVLKNRKNRIGTAPMQLPVRKSESPLAFTIGDTVIHVLDDEEQRILTVAEQLQIPVEYGRDRFREALAGTGFETVRNEKLGNVVRARKTSPGDRSRDRSTTCPQTPRGQVPPPRGVPVPGELPDPY